MSDLKEERDALVREVRETVQREDLKRDILRELQPRTWRSALSRLLQHPAFLALIGFALTGLLGTRIASEWQSKEWDRQQREKIRYALIEQRYGVINELITAVGARNAALRDIADRLTYRGLNRDPSSREILQDNLDSSMKEWNVAAERLRLKIVLYFHNSSIQQLFAQFVDRQNHTTYPQLTHAILEGENQPDAASQWLEHTKTIASQDSQELTPIVTLMWNETESLTVRHNQQSSTEEN